MQSSVRFRVSIPAIAFCLVCFSTKLVGSTGPTGYNREIGNKWIYLQLQNPEFSGIYNHNSAAFTPLVSATTKRLEIKTTRTPFEPSSKLKQHVIRIPEENACGIPKAKPLHTPYVIGGQQANPLEFPWYAALTKYQYNSGGKSNWKVVCGASLINTKFALLAAHCLHGRYKDTLEVVFNLKDSTNISYTASRGEVRRKINRFIIHPQYNARTQHDDIALIELKEPIDYIRREKNLAPICLPESSRHSFASKNGTFIGFGHTSYGSNSPGPKENSRVLMKVQVPILSHGECLKSKVPTKKEVTENMICAGEHGKDACINDSGGPLMVNENGRTVLVGIASWGIGCALEDYPGVYTRVTQYLQWIKASSK